MKPIWIRVEGDDDKSVSELSRSMTFLLISLGIFIGVLLTCVVELCQHYL